MANLQLHRGLTFDQYRQLPGLNCSRLKAIDESPLAFHEWDGGESTSAMDLGRAVHCALLEPERFGLDYAVYDGRRAGKEYDKFREANAGREVLNKAEYERLIAMQKRLRSHPVAGRIVNEAGKLPVLVEREAAMELKVCH